MTESATGAAVPEKAEDFIEQMKVFGLGSSGSLSQVRPFRISTMQETTIMRAVFMKVSGLNSEQFAENPWGFPFVPYPTQNRSTSKTRNVMVPENISFEYAAHPIFWIDPRLTAPTRSESIDPARWSVRMFYLMLALGVMDPESLKWVSGPRGKGVSMSESDLHNHIHDFDSNLSKVLYTTQDLAVPYEDVVDQANVALTQVETLQERQWNVYRAEQKSALHAGQAILAGDEAEWESIEENIREITEQVVKMTAKGVKSTELIAPAYDEAGRLVELINRYERLCVILASPVMRAQARSSSSYTSVATAMQMYNHSVINGGYEEVINKSVEELFSATSVDVDQFVNYSTTAANLYLDVHRRLDLAVENFQLVESGEQPYRDYTEMQMGRGLEREQRQSRASNVGAADDMMSDGLDDELSRLLNG